MFKPGLFDRAGLLDRPWLFRVVIGLDVLMLLLPMRRLAGSFEFWIAAILAAVTGLLWIRLRTSPGD